jgi:hypothetical protein
LVLTTTKLCRREVQVISLVNYELLYLTGLNLTRSETDVIQVFVVCNGRVTVTGRTPLPLSRLLTELGLHSLQPENRASSSDILVGKPTLTKFSSTAQHRRHHDASLHRLYSDTSLA